MICGCSGVRPASLASKPSALLDHFGLTGVLGDEDWDTETTQAPPSPMLFHTRGGSLEEEPNFDEDDSLPFPKALNVHLLSSLMFPSEPLLHRHQCTS